MEISLRGQGTSKVTMGMLEKYPHKIYMRLDEILASRGMTQGELHRLTGIRTATLNEFINGKKQAVNLIHVVTIMCALRISDIRELVSIEFEEDVLNAWEVEMSAYGGSGLTSNQKVEIEQHIKLLYTK